MRSIIAEQLGADLDKVGADAKVRLDAGGERKEVARGVPLRAAAALLTRGGACARVSRRHPWCAAPAGRSLGRELFFFQ